MNGMRFGAGVVVCVLSCLTAAYSADAASGFRRVWERRFRFDNEIPLSADRFVPAAHYSATVVSLPAEMRFVTDGGIVARFAAPEDVKPPYRMHLVLTGAGKPAVFTEKDGELRLAKIAEWPEDFDPRRKENLEKVRFSGTEGLHDRKVALSAGIGQADVRFVTSGRENRPYFENGRAFFTFSARAYGSYLGVMSFDPDRLDFRLEGVILFDYGDGLLRNDVAADLFYDGEAGEWRAYVSNFSTADDSLKGRAKGGVNVAWSKECPLRGISVMRARNLGLPNLNEDPDGFWDAQAKKWRLLVSEFTAKGIRAAMFESENWDGPFARLAGPVDVDSTGTTIAWVDGEPRALFGSATRRFCVRDYPMLTGDGELPVSDPPWNPATSMNGRVWPSLLDCPDGTRYLLTFDRVNFPGMPRPNWTYGKLILYRR